MITPRPLGAPALAAIGAVAFFAGGVYAAPASLLSPAFANANQLTYQRLEGTLWRGVVRGAAVNEFALGDIRFEIHPLSLATGRLKADVNASGGALVGGGAIDLELLTQTVSIADASLDVNLNQIRRYTLFGLPYEGSARASLRRFKWSRQGCIEAEASVWTDALTPSARRLTGEGFELSGPARCDGDRLAFRLDGGNAYGDADIELSVSADLTYELSASVDPKKQEARRSLELLGFEADGGSLVYGAVGPLKGLGS